MPETSKEIVLIIPAEPVVTGQGLDFLTEPESGMEIVTHAQPGPGRTTPADGGY
jgi:hypothetical protein